jgi:hypothetical protein
MIVNSGYIDEPPIDIAYNKNYNCVVGEKWMIKKITIILLIFTLSACATNELETETDTLIEATEVTAGATATTAPEPIAALETPAGNEAETIDGPAQNNKADDEKNSDDNNIGTTQDTQAVVGEWVIPYVMDKGEQSTIEEFAETWDFGVNDAGEGLDLSDFVYEIFSHFVLTVSEDGTGAVTTVTEGEAVTLPLVYTYDGKTLHMTHEDGEEVSVLYFSMAVFEYDEEAGLLINHYWLSSDENTYLVLEKKQAGSEND